MVRAFVLYDEEPDSGRYARQTIFPGIGADGQERLEAAAEAARAQRPVGLQDDMADLVLRYDIGETLGPFVGN